LNSAENDFAEGLLRIFDNVLLTEEKALSKGYFSNLSIAELHTLDAIGPYEARAMTETASRLGITTGTLRRVVRVCLTRQGKLAFRMHAKFHTLLVKRIMEPLGNGDRERLAALVREIDEFITEQYQKYSREESARKGTMIMEDQKNDRSFE